MTINTETVVRHAIQDFEKGNFEEARKKLSYVLSGQPKNLVALEVLGIVYARQENPKQALKQFEKIKKINPDYPQAWLNCGNALLELERYVEALTQFDRAIKLNPAYAKAWSNRGAALQALKQFELARSSSDKAVNINPSDAEAWTNRGNILIELKQYEEALASVDKAISIAPQLAEAWATRGNALLELKQYEHALTSFDRALGVNPHNAKFWSGRGNAHLELKQFELALDCYRRALKIKNDFAGAWYNVGDVLVELKQYEEALESFDKALNIEPNYPLCLGQKMHTQKSICSWVGLDRTLRELTKSIAKGILVSTPFPVLASLDEPKTLLKAADVYLRSKFPARVSRINFPVKAKSEKIRIGYFSADFRNHPISYLMAELFEVHDRSRFEIFGLSFGPNNQDEMRKRISEGVDHFHDVSSMSDRQIAELSRNLGIDIAVDLMGFTRDSRTGIFAEICAPIQVSYLGYPGTMAAPYIDYIIADPVLIPVEMQECYSEKVIYLPDCYQVNDGKRKISKNVYSRSDFGLPNNQFVFCCFNNNYKILPETFDRWIRILNAVEGSVLWLMESNLSSAANLRDEAATRGVDPTRLIFAKSIKLEEHLARHCLADLFLDTLPYNAHTTASDALWAGLPVLTQIGQSFAARVSASLLNTIGLSELVTYNSEQYESVAIELARDSSKLSAIRNKLEINKMSSSLFNAKLFAKHIESAYSLIFERYNSGQQPEHIYV